jgi:hypothetical protein
MTRGPFGSVSSLRRRRRTCTSILRSKTSSWIRIVCRRCSRESGRCRASRNAIKRVFALGQRNRGSAGNSEPPATPVKLPAAKSAAAANNEPAINRGILLADMLDIAGVLRRNVACMRLAVANRRATDQSRRFHQRRRRGRACGPSKGCRASDGLRNCCAIAALSQQHNYSDQVPHDYLASSGYVISARAGALALTPAVFRSQAALCRGL